MSETNGRADVGPEGQATPDVKNAVRAGVDKVAEVDGFAESDAPASLRMANFVSAVREVAGRLDMRVAGAAEQW